MSTIAKTEYKNILIIKPSAAGDIICALPILPALKNRYPNAKITWLIASHLADLLRGHPLLDDLIEFNRRRYGYLTHSWSVTKRFMAFLKILRQERFDLVIDLQGLFRSGFLAWTTQAPVRIGPAEKRELGWIFYTHRIPQLPHDTHIVDRIAALDSLLDLDLTAPKFILHIQDSAKQKINDFLHARDLKPNQFITLAPGGTWPSKRWPTEKFAQLANLIVTQLNYPVVLVGGRSEKPLAESILQKANNPKIFDLTAHTTLPELLAVLANSKALVCNDSGPMHMAVALNIPVTAIIGPTNPQRTGPYRRPQSIVKSAKPCSPCYKRQCTQVPESQIPPCMHEISVDQVFKNLKSQLQIV
ncbi:MAG: lipopolysaccharide heptosyltransferase II [Phycisphaerae bacterium]